MTTYAIGDVQGCYGALRRLLDFVRFDERRDTLWFVGDLVNRGPDSLGVLRFVRSLGTGAVAVLGNHDLHLLCVAAGVQKPRRSDTLDAILAAHDRDELLDWLRRLPLMHVEGGFALVHAGLLPDWSIEEAVSLANQVSDSLVEINYQEFLAAMYGDQPDHWQPNLGGWDRLRVVVNAMTRMRVCTPEGRMQFSYKGSLADLPPGWLPWYAVPGRQSADKTVLFGHWSAHGFSRAHNCIALDTGCLWGGTLSALRLEDRVLFQVGCAAAEQYPRDE